MAKDLGRSKYRITKGEYKSDSEEPILVNIRFIKPAHGSEWTARASEFRTRYDLKRGPSFSGLQLKERYLLGVPLRKQLNNLRIWRNPK